MSVIESNQEQSREVSENVLKSVFVFEIDFVVRRGRVREGAVCVELRCARPYGFRSCSRHVDWK
jgi:hypothetical protein